MNLTSFYYLWFFILNMNFYTAEAPTNFTSARSYFAIPA